MLKKRIISCLMYEMESLLKVLNSWILKILVIPVETARNYYEQGIDELVFYDITASSDKRDIMIDVVSSVASQIFNPILGWWWTSYR